MHIAIQTKINDVFQSRLVFGHILTIFEDVNFNCNDNSKVGSSCHERKHKIYILSKSAYDFDEFFMTFSLRGPEQNVLVAVSLKFEGVGS